MKVLQINAVFGTSSTGRSCLELEEESSKHGIDMYSAYAITGTIKPRNGFIIGSSLDRKIHAFISRALGRQGYASYTPTKKLIRYIKEINPDIIHLNNLHSNFINLRLLLQYIAENDIATVITLHDCWFYTGRCAHYTIDNCQRWKTTCGQCPRLNKDNPSWLLDKSKEMLSDKKDLFKKISKLAVVGVSEWITNEAKQSILSEAKIIQRIYNWIDVDIFKPDPESRKKTLGKLSITNNAFAIIGVATSWSHEKGLDKFIKLSSLLNEDEKIILVGKIPEKTALPSSIIHIQETHDVYELAKLYASSDVFVSFSKEETFGKVTAEALSSGVPVIVNGMTANPELVENQCGFIVNTDIIENVYEKIQIIKKIGKNKFSDNCRSSSIRKFNKIQNTKEYFELYKNLLA